MKTIPHKSVYSTFIILLLIIICEHSIAQVNADSTTYYFDSDLNFCPPDKMTYIGFGKKEDGLFHLSLFTVGDAKLAMTGFYTDSTLKVREGEFNNFDATGHKTSFEHYHKDTIYGYAVWLTDDYLCRDSILFENGVDVMRIEYSYSKGNKINKVVNDNKTGAKDLTTYYEDGSIKSFAHWIKGTGDQTAYYPNSSKVESITTYTNNEITRERYFKEDGTEISADEYKKQKEANTPSYPGGMKAFGYYVVQNMRDVLRSQRYDPNLNGSSYSLTFWVNKKGKIYDLSINGLKSNDPMYINFRQILETAPRWDMKNKEVFGPVFFTLNISTTRGPGDF